MSRQFCFCWMDRGTTRKAWRWSVLGEKIVWFCCVSHHTAHTQASATGCFCGALLPQETSDGTVWEAKHQCSVTELRPFIKWWTLRWAFPHQESCRCHVYPKSWSGGEDVTKTGQDNTGCCQMWKEDKEMCKTCQIFQRRQRGWWQSWQCFVPLLSRPEFSSDVHQRLDLPLSDVTDGLSSRACLDSNDDGLPTSAVYACPKHLKHFGLHFTFVFIKSISLTKKCSELCNV
jgi:hypothetical protein